MKLLGRLLTRYWGYLAVVVAVAGFFLHNIGLAVVIALGLAAIGYFLLQARCGAEQRPGPASTAEKTPTGYSADAPTASTSGNEPSKPSPPQGHRQ